MIDFTKYTEKEKELLINFMREIAIELKGTDKKKIAKFVKPTIEEIKAYCDERRNHVSPENFFDFYESKGWKVGGQSMKDWKACIRTWERRDNGTDKKRNKEQERNYTEEDLDKLYDDLDSIKL